MNFALPQRCAKCPYGPVNNLGLYDPIPTTICPGSLAPSPTTPAIYCIGQNPGSVECAGKGNFLGESGAIFHNDYIPPLKAKATIYLANSVRCGPDSIDQTPIHACCLAQSFIDLAAICEAHPDPTKVAVLLMSSPGTGGFFKRATGKAITQKQAFSRNGKPLTIHGRTIPIFATFNPAAVMYELRLLHAVRPHINLIVRWLDGLARPPSDPYIVPARAFREPAPRPLTVRPI